MTRSGSPSRPRPAIAELAAVSKWYGPVIAVNDVTLRIVPGVTGLVGPNGAGKTTMIRLLTGQLRPSLGSVFIRGKDAWNPAAKCNVGYCPDADAFYEEMSGRRFVQTVARFHGSSTRNARLRTEAVLDQVGMTDRADRPLGSYSKGMRQRIKLAQALVHDPLLIVLDEPLNGVDPVGRVELVDLFLQLADGGKAILVSSHVLEEMDALADHILFMCRGRILADGTLPEIRRMLDDHPLHVRITSATPQALASRLFQLPMVRTVRLQGGEDLEVQVHQPYDFFQAFTELAGSEDFHVERMQVTDASTEAIFDYLIQKATHP